MKKILILFVSCFLVACGGGSSDSGGMDTLPGTNVPASFAGLYTGMATIEAMALGISESDSFPINITVTEDAMVTFTGDDPEETFTVGLTNDGAFSSSLPINEDPCTGTVTVTGSVDGTTASGDISGEGRCQFNGVEVEVTLSGTFNATR